MYEKKLQYSPWSDVDLRRENKVQLKWQYYVSLNSWSNLFCQGRRRSEYYRQ